MTPTRISAQHPTRPLWLLAAALVCLPALGAGPSATPAATSTYQRDSARCMSIREHDQRANCLSEASTANAARQPPQADTDPGRYARNAVERCKALRDPDRGDCIARIQGAGTTSGSVAAGGIYRELVTRETATPDAPPPK